MPYPLAGGSRCGRGLLDPQQGGTAHHLLQVRQGKVQVGGGATVQQRGLRDRARVCMDFVVALSVRVFEMGLNGFGASADDGVGGEQAGRARGD